MIHSNYFLLTLTSESVCMTRQTFLASSSLSWTGFFILFFPLMLSLICARSLKSTASVVPEPAVPWAAPEIRAPNATASPKIQKKQG